MPMSARHVAVPKVHRSPIPDSLAESPVRSYARTDHPFRRGLGQSATVELLLTMGQLNRMLTCFFASGPVCLGTY